MTFVSYGFAWWHIALLPAGISELDHMLGGGIPLGFTVAATDDRQ